MSELDDSHDRENDFINALQVNNTIFNILMFFLGFLFLYSYSFINDEITNVIAMLTFSVLFCYISLHVYLMNKIINSKLH
jgi:CBS domain containing-hemolysin-like protein